MEEIKENRIAMHFELYVAGIEAALETAEVHSLVMGIYCKICSFAACCRDAVGIFEYASHVFKQTIKSPVS